MDTHNIISKFKKLRRKLKRQGVKGTLKKVFYNQNFVLVVLIIVFLVNSLVVFRLHYVENYELAYRWERVTVKLIDDKFLELYRYHDFIQLEDGTSRTLLTGTVDTLPKVTNHQLFNIPEKVVEATGDENAQIRTELTRISPNNFTLSRSYTFTQASLAQAIDTLYFQVVIGGDGIHYSRIGNSIRYGKCEVVMYPEEGLLSIYKATEKVLIFGKKVDDQQELNFAINFTIDCD